MVNSNASGCIGIDLGDRVSDVCVVHAGKVQERFKFGMSREALRRAFGERARGRVVLEAGAQSAWVARELVELGFEVVTANPRLLNGAGRRKNDRRDAEWLARLAQMGELDPKLLCPVTPRSAKRADALVVLKARDSLVRARARLVSTVRSAAKLTGGRMPKCGAEHFADKEPSVPVELQPILAPLFVALRSMNEQVDTYDAQIVELVETQFPDAKGPLQVKGVGALTALAFVLVLDDPSKFKSGRHAAAYLGLVPQQSQSGASDPQMRISKAGNGFLRKLLVQSAHWILGPFGPDCDLRRLGERLAARGGPNAKKRAIVAVARRLVVLMFRLWRTQEPWIPLFNETKALGPTSSVPPEGHPSSNVLDDCARPLAPRERPADCSVERRSEPSMQPADQQDTADRSVDRGVTSGARRTSEEGTATSPSSTGRARALARPSEAGATGAGARYAARSTPTPSGPVRRAAYPADSRRSPSGPNVTHPLGQREPEEKGTPGDGIA